MQYSYTCPVCDETFESEVKNGTVECPHCAEDLEVVDGESAYILEDEDFDDEDYDEDDEDMKEDE